MNPLVYWLASSSLIAATAAAAERVSALDLLRRQQSAPTDAVVEYCRRESPDTTDMVQAGYAVYRTSLDKAMTAWLAEKPELKKHLHAQVPLDSQQNKDAEASFKAITATILEGVKRYDPKEYCPWMAERLKAATPESILKSLHEYDARVESQRAKPK